MLRDERSHSLVVNKHHEAYTGSQQAVTQVKGNLLRKRHYGGGRPTRVSGEDSMKLPQ